MPIPTVIAIDDSRVDLQLFIDVLRIIGIEVLASGTDGKDAVRLYKKYTPILFLQIY